MEANCLLWPSRNELGDANGQLRFKASDNGEYIKSIGDRDLIRFELRFICVD